MDEGGVLNLNKPPGVTSHDVVDRVRGILGLRRVGHAGTLDPFAEGILLVGFGPGTKILKFLGDLPKEYLATLLLGEETDTLDSDGRTVRECPVPTLDEEQVRRALNSFLGPQEQRPPAYSALKVGGIPAYRLAREGREVDLAPRPIEVFSLSLTLWDPPRLGFRVSASKGTYVRQLGSDLAVRMGTCGHLVSLTRTAVGSHTLDSAVSLEDLDREHAGERPRTALPLSDALAHLPRVRLDAEGAAAMRNGLLLEGHFSLDEGLGEGALSAALDPSGSLAAILSSKAPSTPGRESAAAFSIERVLKT